MAAGVSSERTAFVMIDAGRGDALYANIRATVSRGSSSSRNI